MRRKTGYYLDLILVLTQKEIKVRYKSSFLGYIWSIANPLAYAFVFFIAFKVIMKFSVDNYVLFLISGLFPWQWISNSLNTGAGVYIGNSYLIKKLAFPREFLPLAVVLNDAFHFVVSIPVIILFLFIYHKYPALNWIYGIPLLLIPTFFLSYGLALAASSINLFFRDLQNLIGIVTAFLFYMTPILYPVTTLPAKFRHLMILNPFAPIIISWRELFLKGTFSFHYFLISLIVSVIIFIIGYAVHYRLRDRFAEVV